jgi:hypothetical protein
LLEAVLAGTPRLSGPLCAGHPDVFDGPAGKFDDDTSQSRLVVRRDWSTSFRLSRVKMRVTADRMRVR